MIISVKIKNVRKVKFLLLNDQALCNSDACLGFFHQWQNPCNGGQKYFHAQNFSAPPPLKIFMART